MSVNVPLRSRATLARGVLAFRWTALVWMSVVALTSGPYRRAGVVWTAIAVAALWTLFVSRRSARTLCVTAAPPSARGPKGGRGTLYHIADLLLAAALCIASALAVPDGTVGTRPFLATAYPAAAVLAWAVHGMRSGLVSAVAVGGAIVAARPLGGVNIAALSSQELQTLANGVITYLLAGGATGLVADLLARSADAVDRAVERQMVEAQRAARLGEREVLARRIHDSVLQSLALVHKRGREIGNAAKINPADVVALAELAGSQEQALRTLIIRREEEAPLGTASLRDRVEALVAEYAEHLPVTAASAGPAMLPMHYADEISSAVRQALDNIVEHAFASRVHVFVDDAGDEVVVSVRDDGRGFDVDQAEGFGLRSMQGRVEDLGGTFTISSTADGGTEIEMTVPKPAGEEQ